MAEEIISIGDTVRIRVSSQEFNGVSVIDVVEQRSVGDDWICYPPGIYWEAATMVAVARAILKLAGERA